ncbi:hypothetical protein Dimus_004940 [Dionaea muscipula]
MKWIRTTINVVFVKKMKLCSLYASPPTSPKMGTGFLADIFVAENSKFSEEKSSSVISISVVWLQISQIATTNFPLLCPFLILIGFHWVSAWYYYYFFCMQNPLYLSSLAIALLGKQKLNPFPVSDLRVVYWV